MSVSEMAAVCSMPNVEDDDLVGSIAQGIENQKRVSHHGHHAHAFLIGAMTYKRQFADQRGQPLNTIDDATAAEGLRS